jgi:signal peptidase I
VLNKEKLIKETKSLVFIFLVVMGIRSSFFEPFHIPSGSMIPNLFIGDFVLVNKLSYGFKLPFSDYLKSPVYLTSFVEPKRGDIIVFRYPRDTNISFIKRVIGLPGDEIEIINKQVILNGKPLPQDLPKNVDSNFDKSFKGEPVRFLQSKVGDKEFVMQMTDRQMPVDNYPKFKVPADSYWAMGDNRDFSADSRYWGFVPKENIRGKAMFVWFSFKNPIQDEVESGDYRLQMFRIGHTLW